MNKIYTHNRLFIVEMVVNPWVVIGRCVIRQERFRIALKELFSLDSSFVGQEIYIDGEVDEPTRQIMFASCYLRDANGCVEFINNKRKG